MTKRRQIKRFSSEQLDIRIWNNIKSVEIGILWNYLATSLTYNNTLIWNVKRAVLNNIEYP